MTGDRRAPVQAKRRRYYVVTAHVYHARGIGSYYAEWDTLAEARRDTERISHLNYSHICTRHKYRATP